LGPVFLAACWVGCSTPQTRAPKAPPPPDLKPTVIAYAETEAFDALLESALSNQDSVIIIQTQHEKPDWGGTLNAWIAAWNMGGKVEEPKPGRKIRLQAALAANPESLHEFRLLIESLMTRIEQLARAGGSWWTMEKVRSHRVELLKPYNLRFHLDENGFIQIILFNGQYAQYYKQFVESIAAPDEEECAGCGRVFTCSCCRKAALSTTLH
jgi:hypothetical protein